MFFLKPNYHRLCSSSKNKGFDPLQSRPSWTWNSVGFWAPYLKPFLCGGSDLQIQFFSWKGLSLGGREDPPLAEFLTTYMICLGGKELGGHVVVYRFVDFAPWLPYDELMRMWTRFQRKVMILPVMIMEWREHVLEVQSKIMFWNWVDFHNLPSYSMQIVDILSKHLYWSKNCQLNVCVLFIWSMKWLGFSRASWILIPFQTPDKET